MRRFGLIGKSLKHSFSKDFFTKKFAAEGLNDCSYELFELEHIEQLPGLISAQCPEGLNVTIPYKTEVLPYLDHQDEAVEKIGACNCIRISGGKLYGFNTDAPAFLASLKKYLQPQHQCALVLGTGGASKAVCFALEQMHLDYLQVSRRKHGSEIGYEDVSPEMISKHKVIINTTPLGMFPNTNQEPAIPYESITADHLLFDLVYNPAKTKFLEKGERMGATVVNGYEMLVLQAEESWKIWNASED